MQEYLFLRSRQQFALQTLHLYTAHKPNASNSAAGSLPASSPESICSVTSPSKARTPFERAAAAFDGPLLAAGAGGSSNSAFAGGSSSRSRAADISAMRLVASSIMPRFRSGCHLIASFLKAAWMASDAGGVPFSPGSMPSTEQASTTRDGMLRRRRSASSARGRGARSSVALHSSV